MNLHWWVNMKLLYGSPIKQECVQCGAVRERKILQRDRDGYTLAGWRTTRGTASPRCIYQKSLWTAGERDLCA